MGRVVIICVLLGYIAGMVVSDMYPVRGTQFFIGFGITLVAALLFIIFWLIDTNKRERMRDIARSGGGLNEAQERLRSPKATRDVRYEQRSFIEDRQYSLPPAEYQDDYDDEAYYEHPSRRPTRQISEDEDYYDQPTRRVTREHPVTQRNPQYRPSRNTTQHPVRRPTRQY